MGTSVPGSVVGDGWDEMFPKAMRPFVDIYKHNTKLYNYIMEIMMFYAVAIKFCAVLSSQYS